MSVETAMTHPTPTGRRPALKPTGPADNLSWNLDAASLGPRRSPPPLALPALAMASGIALDRAIAPSDQRAWIASAVLAGILIVAAIMFKRRWVGRFGLGLLLLGLGGAWHHGFWFDRPADSLDRIDLESPTACRVRGVLLDIPERLPGGPFDPEGSTRLLLRTTAIDLGDGWRAASGGVLIYVNGRIDGLAMGGPALARGTLTAIEGPKNPGESDRREYWRSRDVGHRLRAERRGGLVPDSAGTPDAWLGLLGRLREHARRALVDRLDPEASAVASALVLGRREAIDPEVSEAFARTGVTHILAISGLHMVAVAGMLGLALSTLGWRRRPVSLAVLVATIAYAFLVGLRPSVVRASAMTVAGCYAGLRDRRPRMSDLLALAGPITLAINPAYLFDVGCQLSFLAVAALAWAGRPLARRFGLGVRPDRVDPEASPTAQLDALELQYGPAWRRWFHKWTASMTALLLASAAVWAVTLPLVAMRFHLVPIAGILLNLALVPMAAPILGTAVLALGLGLIDPSMAAPPAWACSRLIESMIGLVRFGARFPGGFAFTAGPPGWWVAAFYGGLVMTAWASFRVGILRRVAWTSLLAWTAFGVGLATLPSRPTVAEADVLAVDHGLAVVVRSPTGRTLLYDCGRMYGPRVGREVVAPAIWAIGARRIDVAVISHADDDHYNGFADLMDRIPIGEVRVSPGFDGPENPGAVALVDQFMRRGVPVRPISAGDRIDLGDGFGAKVLHPPSDWMPDAPDNARSLVLDLGRLDGLGDRFLLTGDLEGAGLAEFWADPPPPPAAMLAPHHGGKASNPDWFYDAIRPDLLVASQRRPPYPETEALAPLERGGLPVWRTWRDGAIRLRWTNQGIRADSFLDAKRRVKSTLLESKIATGPFALWNPPGIAVGLRGVGVSGGARGGTCVGDRRVRGLDLGGPGTSCGVGPSFVRARSLGADRGHDGRRHDPGRRLARLAWVRRPDRRGRPRLRRGSRRAPRPGQGALGLRLERRSARLPGPGRLRR